MASSQRLATFAPNQVYITITQESTGISHTLSGFSEDSIVNIERMAETYTLYTGADNTSTRVYNASKSATVTLSLQQSSASNDVLSLLYQNDSAAPSSDGLFSIYITDAGGRSRYFSDNAYVGVVPNSPFANSMQTRDWVIHAHDLETTIGGNAILTPEDQETILALGGTIDDRWI